MTAAEELESWYEDLSSWEQFQDEIEQTCCISTTSEPTEERPQEVMNNVDKIISE